VRDCRAALVHDDRIDAVAGAVAYFERATMMDVNQAAKAMKDVEDGGGNRGLPWKREASTEFAADSPLEEGGFEPLVPPQSQHNRGTGPMSPTASIRVGLVIPLANSISISVGSGTSGSNPLSSCGESCANPTFEGALSRRRTRSGHLASKPIAGTPRI
jgi:hypothetical protein